MDLEQLTSCIACHHVGSRLVPTQEGSCHSELEELALHAVHPQYPVEAGPSPILLESLIPPITVQSPKYDDSRTSAKEEQEDFDHDELVEEHSHRNFCNCYFPAHFIHNE